VFEIYGTHLVEPIQITENFANHFIWFIIILIQVMLVPLKLSLVLFPLFPYVYFLILILLYEEVLNDHWHINLMNFMVFQVLLLGLYRYFCAFSSVYFNHSLPSELFPFLCVQTAIVPVLKKMQ